MVIDVIMPQLRESVSEGTISKWRVRQGDVRYVCAGCAMTMDYNTGRLTVIYDPKTERIKTLGCN